MPHLPVTLALVAAIAVGAPAYAKNDKASGNAGGKPAHAGKPATRSTGGSEAVDAAVAAGAVLAGVLLSDAEKAIITRYFRNHPQPATTLPPGIAKNLARGKPLPPGIAKKAAPGDLVNRLSIPEGFELQTVGTDVVLIEIGSRIVADVLKDVLRP